MNDDSILLRRFVSERSEEAFAEVVRRHLDFVFSVAMRQVRGDRARAQDITQEVFIVLARKASSLQHRPSLTGWLHIGVHHAAKHLMRSEQRRQRREHEAWAMQEQSSFPAVSADWELIKPALNSAVDALGPKDREILLLRFYQQQSFVEIGRGLRMSADAAQKRAERALEKMRCALARQGLTSTAAALATMLAASAVEAAPAGLAGPIAREAMVAGAARAGAQALFHFMNLAKTQWAVGAALLAIAAIVIVRQQRGEERLRAQIAALESRDHPLPRLHSGAAAVRSALGSIEAARPPAGDVMARGNAVASSEAWPALAPGRMRPTSSLHNAGDATPAAALETLLWAKENLDFDTFNHLLCFTDEVQKKADALYAEMPPDQLQQLGLTKPSKLVAYSFVGLVRPLSGIQVLEAGQMSPDVAGFRTLMQTPDGGTEHADFVFQHIGGEWYWIFPSNMMDQLPAELDERAAALAAKK